MAEAQPHIATDRLKIRSYTSADLGAVQRLFEVGRLAGQVMANDTAADVDNIDEAYMSDPGAHFWVAEYEGRVVGMVGVTGEDRHTAEVRRLRVDPSMRGRGVAVRLMEAALTFCREHEYLKVVFDTHMEHDRDTREIFDRFAFQHNRTRNVGGKQIQEFYLDLYREPKKDETQGHSG